MTPSAILSAAADLLEEPGAWTRRELARDANGRSCLPDSPAATRWCVLGALAKVSDKGTINLGAERDAIGRVVGEMSINIWNDAPGRTRGEVVAALRRAAAL